MTRKSNWELLLHTFVDSRVETPFAYGTNDCAIFTCDGIQAMTETDIAVAFRGKYTTAMGALATIKTVTGGATVEDVAVFVAKEFAMRELSGVLFAQRGDAVLFDGSEGPALGLVYLDGKNAVFVADKGLQKIPVKKCRRAWKVG